MKKFFSSASCLLMLGFTMVFISSSATAQTASSPALAYLPENTTAFAALDMKKMWSLPFFTQLRNSTPELSSSLNEFENNVKKISLKPEDVAVSALMFIGDVAQNEGGIIINTKLTEQKFEEILSGKVFGEAFKYETMTVSDRKVFVVKDDSPGGRDMAFSFVAKDYVIAMDSSKIINYFQSKKGLSADIAKKASAIDTKALAWGFFSIPKADAADQMHGAPLPFPSKVRNADFSLNVSGPTSSDLSIKLSLYCDDQNSAAETLMGCSQTLALMQLMVPGMKPELANQLMASIKLNQAAEAVKIDINLKESTLKQLFELKDSLSNTGMPQAGAFAAPME